MSKIYVDHNDKKIFKQTLFNGVDDVWKILKFYKKYYKIHDILKTIFYTDVCTIINDYVDDIFEIEYNYTFRFRSGNLTNLIIIFKSKNIILNYEQITFNFSFYIWISDCNINYCLQKHNEISGINEYFDSYVCPDDYLDFFDKYIYDTYYKKYKLSNNSSMLDVQNNNYSYVTNVGTVVYVTRIIKNNRQLTNIIVIMKIITNIIKQVSKKIQKENLNYTII
jgi:hypothetical protein